MLVIRILYFTFTIYRSHSIDTPWAKMKMVVLLHWVVNIYAPYFKGIFSAGTIKFAKYIVNFS